MKKSGKFRRVVYPKMEERDFICETDFSSSCVDSDASPDLFRLATAQSHRPSHSTAVRRLSFGTSGCQSPGSCNTPHTLPQRGSDGRLSSATSSASRETSHSSFVPRSAALETSSDILAQILREVQKTSKEVDQVKACLSDLDKRMAAVEQKESGMSSGSGSSTERTPTCGVPNKVRVS